MRVPEREKGEGSREGEGREFLRGRRVRVPEREKGESSREGEGESWYGMREMSVTQDWWNLVLHVYHRVSARGVGGRS